MIRKTILLLGLLMFCALPVSANITIPNPADIAAGAFADGIDIAMIRTADSLMSFTSEPVNATGDDATRDRIKSSIVDRIISFASWSIMPYEYDSIQKMLCWTFLVALVILIAYCFLGAAYCNLNKFTPRGKTFFHIMDGGHTDNELQNYSQNIVWGCVAMSFMPFVVYVVLIAAQALKEMAMLSIAEMIVPCEAIPFLYLAMAIMWLCLSLFFGISNVVILVTGAASFILGALYASDRTRHVCTGWFEYFFGCAFMQVIVVVGVVAIVATMTEIEAKYPLEWAVSGIDIPMYVGTILGATYIAYRLVFGKTQIIKSSTRLLAKVI